jgi:hypothetical protein
VPYSERFPIFGAQYFPSQQPTDASHRFTCFRHWRTTKGGKENTARQTPGTVRNRTHVHINFVLRITDNMTSQNIDLSSCDTLYNVDSRMIGWRWIGKNLEGSDRNLIEVQYRHYPGGTEESHKSPSQGSLYPGGDSIRAPPEYESSTLPRHQPLRYKHAAFDAAVLKLRIRGILRSYGLWHRVVCYKGTDVSE